MASIKKRMARDDVFKSTADPRHDRIRDLLRQIDGLQAKLKTADEQRMAVEAARAEYAKVATFFSERNTAEQSRVSPVESVSIKWLESVHGECRRAKIVIPNTWNKPRIFAMSDQQLGHVTCDTERIKRDIDWAARDGEVLGVLVGDSIDAATRHGKGSPSENRNRPIQQIREFCEMYKPIATQIIGIVGGNHERRIDIALDEPGAGVRLIAEGLSRDNWKIPYSGGILLLDVHWKGHLWTFTLFHGAGAAQTAGAKVQRIQRNILLTDSLITISGHLHDEAKTSRRFLKRQSDGSIKVIKQTGLQCGTYLKYLGSYGEVGGMSPTGPDMIVIELFQDGRYVDRFKGESDS